MMKKNNYKGGFTVVESLVAIMVLVFVITGATAAIQSGISSYTLSKEQVIAFYLAQEGYEHVRNLRDENGLKNRDWLTGLAESSGDPCYFGEACYVDAITGLPFVRCSAPGSCPRLRQDPDEGFYGYNGSWEETPYTREIQLVEVDEDEVAVLVTISWQKGIIEREFRVRANIYNWQ